MKTTTIIEIQFPEELKYLESFEAYGITFKNKYYSDTISCSPKEIRTELKRFGFKWAPSQGAWQNYRNRTNLDNAKNINLLTLW